MKNIKGKSYTPMAAALQKCIRLIKVEKLKNRNIIPVIFILSDCGANISVKHPDLIAQIENDYLLVVGIHPYSAEKIKKNFRKYGKAMVYQFDRYNPSALILELKRIL